MGSMVDGLTERLDRLQRLMRARQVPVRPQLVTTRLRPLDDETPGPRRKLSGEDLECLEIDRRFIPGVTRVEVRATAVVARRGTSRS